MHNNREDYPKQFYTVPHIKSRKDYELCHLKLLAAIANEMHATRMAIEHVHEKVLKKEVENDQTRGTQETDPRSE